jgi:DNA-binding HxlR family transcriptional regulator
LFTKKEKYAILKRVIKKSGESSEMEEKAKKDDADAAHRETTEIEEIEELIKEFKEKFKTGTIDPEKFITIHEIERIWGELRSATNNIYTEMLSELLSSVEETELIRKKKENTEKEE